MRVLNLIVVEVVFMGALLGLTEAQSTRQGSPGKGATPKKEQTRHTQKSCEQIIAEWTHEGETYHTHEETYGTFAIVPPAGCAVKMECEEGHPDCTLDNARKVPICLHGDHWVSLCE